MVRTDTSIETMADSVRAALRRVDRTLAAHDVAAMDEYYAETIERERFGTQMMTTFGLFGLVLAALGVYGVTSFAVAQRVPEIGVRIALGAAPGRILRQVIGRGLRLGLAGILIGAFGSHLVVGLIRAGMPGMRASETAALAGAALALIAVSIVACYVPARRAARIDPLQALRQE
jgi:putative ABC transport system permease protein